MKTNFTLDGINYTGDFDTETGRITNIAKGFNPDDVLFRANHNGALLIGTLKQLLESGVRPGEIMYAVAWYPVSSEFFLGDTNPDEFPGDWNYDEQRWELNGKPLEWV